MGQDYDDKNPKSADELQGKSLRKILEEQRTVPFHMPGHKRNEAFDYLHGLQEIDFTEIDGTDNLHNPQGVLKDAMDLSARVFEAKQTRFLVNGSTVGILAGLRTLAKRGDVVLVARNCHKSVLNAIELLGLVPEYILPTYFEKYGFYGSVLPSDVAKRLEETNAKAVVITSPTYEGIISDIKEISMLCHAYGATLLVDEAHGAHLGLSTDFPKSARTLGADIVVNSLHKTLASLTQTALLHVCTDNVDTSRLDESLAMFETSSPSYVLMSSIDGCVRYVAKHRIEIADWAILVKALKKYLRECKNVKLFDKSMLDDNDKQKVFDYDDSKLVFLTNGVKFAEVLRKEYDIEIEMASKKYAILMTGLGDTLNSLCALKDVLVEIDNKAKDLALTENETQDAILRELPQKAFNPCEMDGLSIEYANCKDIAGRVSAENIWAYPPGAPIVVKGEIVDERTLAYLEDLCASGVDVSSSLKDFPSALAVVKN